MVVNVDDDVAEVGRIGAYTAYSSNTLQIRAF